MRSQIRKALQTVGTPLILSALIWGCESNPADPSIVPDENTTANQAARISVDLYNTVASVQTASEFMRGAGEKVELQDVNINNPSGAFAHAKRARQVVLADLAAHGAAINHIDGIAADSLLWQVTNQKPFLGYTETVRLFYDAATGKARLEAIKYNFDNRHWQQYDSAAIRADLNGTLFDDSDDVLLSLQQLQRYKAGHHLQQKQSTFTPDAYAAGSEPTGGIFESTTIYNESSFIQKPKSAQNGIRPLAVSGKKQSLTPTARAVPKKPFSTQMKPAASKKCVVTVPKYPAPLTALSTTATAAFRKMSPIQSAAIQYRLQSPAPSAWTPIPVCTAPSQKK